MKKLFLIMLSIAILIPACKKEKEAELEEKDPIKANIMLLDSDILTKRKEAMDALKAVGEPAIEPLFDAFSYGSEVLKTNAMTLIEELDPDWFKRESAEKVVSHLIVNLANENSDKREHAADSLELIGNPAIEQLIAALRNENKFISENAGHIIMAIDPYWLESEVGIRSIPDFIKSLKDENANVRRNTTNALIKIGHAAFEQLIPALLDDDIKFQKRVKWILGQIEPGWVTSEQALKFMPDFIKATDNESEAIRLIAIEILGEMKDERAIEPLILALDDDFLYARKAAESSLQSITGEDFGGDKEKWQKWFKENKAGSK